MNVKSSDIRHNNMSEIIVLSCESEFYFILLFFWIRILFDGDEEDMSCIL
jgi:hypothetical protein